MTRDVRMWTALAWLMKGLVRGLVFTETELGIIQHINTGSRNRSIV